VHRSIQGYLIVRTILILPAVLLDRYWMTSSAVANSVSGIVRPSGGLEVDDEIEFGRLLDRQIGWFLAFENAPGIDASLVVRIVDAAAIAHQAAGQGEHTVW
jgi:hypothetical protein